MKFLRILIGLLLILNIFTIGELTASTNPELYSRISYINENYSYIYCGTCCIDDRTGTEFFFSIQVEIWNPSDSSINITTSTYVLLDTGIEAQLENETFLAFDGSTPVHIANQHTIPSGISQHEYLMSFIVCPGDLHSLPDGNYTFWVEIATNTEIAHMKSYLKVNDTGDFYSYEEFSTITNTINNNVAINIIATLSLGTIILRRLKTKR